MKNIKRGIAQITDATVAYGIATVIVVTLLIPLMIYGAEEYRMNVAAGQANTVQKAVNRYIADQQATIAAGSSATSGYTLTVPMLVSAGYLPDGFSSTNAYTATYQTLIFQPTASKFHTMTFLTGGSQLSLSEARKLANHIGAGGGYIENGVAKGALGSWQENLSAFGGYNPGDAHVVIAGFYANGAVVNDYLYRHSVAGHPELNTMGTTLNMDSNDISGAKTMGTQTLNASADVNTARLTATQSIQSNGTINANGSITTNSNMAAAGNITTSSSIAANGNVTANNDVIAVGTLRGNNDLVLGGVIKLNQVNTQGTNCDTWGAISRNGAGAVLSCQSGIWKLQSTPLDTFTVQSAGTCANLTQQIATCPTGSKMVSGGWIMTKFGDGAAHNNPDNSYPDPGSNSWVINTPNNSSHTSCFVALANCARQ
ncbi:shufflon system plasmid conjugative transfer pilus tip adhesin PilV [Erwinia psidii]|uniref:shufflon system plasmid conjugative transfer pilus tip adhesin PilV n=1 Tax=Erwinia psidii TaxID=69224 RepID=UPI00226B2C85|nr:shufflon system plasmid conjugative transfer pilus tip adhesin PilV [Erwinia psidii]MCX8963105.1 shufflon system plasmid conjugative transfer pilus tip adhesin PilV [Erwinia psidii]